MKKPNIIFLVSVASFLIVCGPLFAVGRRVGAGVGSPTVPPSRYGRSMHRSPSYTQNRLRNEAAITGNIAGGGGFKGNVPYRSSYEFQGPSATSTINNFLRNSSQPLYNRSRSTDLTPYYLPSRTVSTLRRNDTPGNVPPTLYTPGQADRYKNVYQSDITTADVAPTLRYRPLPLNISELELKVIREAKATNLDFRDLRELRSNDVIRDILTGERDIDLKDIDKKAKDVEVAEDQDLFTVVEPLSPVEPAEPIEPGREKTVQENLRTLEDRLKELEDQAVEIEDEDDEAEEDAEEDEEAEEKNEVEEFSEKFLKQIDHETARGILGKHKSFKEYAAAKYDGYLRIGDSHLLAGKFYKAADAYTLAEIYNFDRPEASGRKGLALFVAGEYLTSAGYVEKAVSISPEYASKKINLAAIVDDETLDKRLANLEQWYEMNKSPQFMFLASYIYYQRGDMKKASESLDKAAIKMQGRPSLDAMRMAIETR